MTIAEKFKEKEKLQKMNRLNNEANKRKTLASTIENKVFKNKEIINKITELLIDYGQVTVTGLGCLCQGGLCSWQKGFTEYLTQYEKEWNKEGIEVRYGIDGLTFNVEGKYKPFSSGPKLLMKEWL